MPFPVGLRYVSRTIDLGLQSNEILFRIWDAFLYFGFRIVYQVALALFKIFEDKILSMQFEDILSFLSFAHNEESTDTLDPEQLMVVAKSFKIKGKAEGGIFEFRNDSFLRCCC